VKLSAPLTDGFGPSLLLQQIANLGKQLDFRRYRRSCRWFLRFQLAYAFNRNEKHPRDYHKIDGHSYKLAPAKDGSLLFIIGRVRFGSFKGKKRTRSDA
jgi:hypothetical protein